MWYHRHQDELLDYRHRFLIDYSLSNVERWTRITQTSKVAMLDNAMQFYKIQCGQSARHQSTIYDWMDRNINSAVVESLVRASLMHGMLADDHLTMLPLCLKQIQPF